MPKADHMATDGRFAPLRLSTLIHAKWETNNDGGDMPKSRTLMGIEYEYSGSLNTGLIVHKKVDIHISANAIRLIIAEITDKSPILMGACRDNPIKGSIGAMLRKNRILATVFKLRNSTTYRGGIL